MHHSKRKAVLTSSRTLAVAAIVACLMLVVFRMGTLYGRRNCSLVSPRSPAHEDVTRHDATPTNTAGTTISPPPVQPDPHRDALALQEDAVTGSTYDHQLSRIVFDDSHILPYGNHTAEVIHHYLVRRAKRRQPAAGAAPPATLFLVPVNEGYLDFGLNLMCSLFNVSGGATPTASAQETPLEVRNTGAYEGFVFIAMDEPAHKQLSDMRLPVVRDPDVPFVTSKSAAWADPKFHSLVCTKLIPVLRALKQGLRVVLTDADIVYLANPVPYFRSDVSLTFSIGSCHKDLHDNFHFTADGIEKLNTGFYVAHPTDEVLALFTSALEVCRTSSLTGDQPAINSIIQRDWNTGTLATKAGTDDAAASSAYSYGFFDGCLFANGCVFFKHLCQNTTKYPAHAKRWMSQTLQAVPRSGAPTLVHANFLVGKKNKIKHLTKYQLWDTACVDHFRRRLPKGP